MFLFTDMGLGLILLGDACVNVVIIGHWTERK